LLYQNSLQKRRRESGCKKTGGGGQVGNHGFPDSSFCFFCLVFRVYFTESKFCFFSKRTAVPVFRNYIRLQGWSQFLKALTTYPVWLVDEKQVE
jgi:hypothetical protein